MNSVPRSSAFRPGFTLFEVAVSAALVAGCLVGVLLVFPIGLRAQQQARFQVYAGVKVLEMIDTFANNDHTFPSHQLEGDELGQCMMPRQWPVDLDRMMMTPSMGLLPLPDSIARRLDSDGDEIAKILDAGGRLYYASPAAYDVGYHAHAGGRNAYNLAKERALPPEAQSILFAVVGDPQENALPGHPCITTRWVFYPSMASTGSAPGTDSWVGFYNHYEWEAKMWMNDYAYFGANSNASQHFSNPNHTGIADLCPSWRYTWYNTYAPNNNPPIIHTGEHGITNDLTRIKNYIHEAQQMLLALSVPLSGTDPYLLPPAPADLTTKTKPWSRNDFDIYPPPAFIGALRFLAAGALARTGWHMVNGAWCPGQGLSSPPYPTFNNPGAPLTQADIDYCKDLQELVMRWSRRYAMTDPYDWGAPRPLNRPSCYDLPLLEYDLFQPYACTKSSLQGDSTNPSAPDVTWRICSPVMPTNYPRGYTDGAVGHDNHQYITDSFAKDDNGIANGNPTHFNLAAPFSAAERCRDIVCWAVDWKAYEDYETAPSSPWDASMCFYDSAGNMVDNEIVQYPPDYSLAWADANHTTIAPAPADGDPGAGASFRKAWFGLWGIDRDGNGKCDHGPLPVAARLRAVSIGRWHYYDRRLISALRN